MDDQRIQQLTEEVLAQIGEPKANELQDRLHALEAEVRALRTPGASATTVAVVQVASHPSFGLLPVADGGERGCVMEPDKPCTNSGACRTFGH